MKVRVSFTPKGDWFVFDAETGETLNQGFKTRDGAFAWIAREHLAGRWMECDQ